MTEHALDPAPGRVAFLHAHPDDECLSTGALIAELARRGRRVFVVTATRGERGETTPGYESLAGTAQLSARRDRELCEALEILGVERHAYLGEPPARAAGLPPRRYRDSGMAWVTPEWAGPADDAGSDSLAGSDRSEAAADLAACLDDWDAELLVSYDARGGYGHPDHVACHEIAVAAARDAGVPLWTIGDVALRGPQAGEVLVDLPEHRRTVARALSKHASQIVVEGNEIVYSGGQRHPVPTGAILRRAASDAR